MGRGRIDFHWNEFGRPAVTSTRMALRTCGPSRLTDGDTNGSGRNSGCRVNLYKAGVYEVLTCAWILRVVYADRPRRSGDLWTGDEP